jgi:cellulose synthase/poly-beta-1,6-N-acetylglucosamine synthase-like glycosyltransferase
MIWFFWISGLALAVVWFVGWLQTVTHLSEIIDITRPEWDVPSDAALPSLSIMVPARNEEEEIEPALRSLLALKHPDYEVIAVNDRSTDSTGDIMEKIASEQGPAQKLRVLHVNELPEGWLGKTHAMWLAAQQARGEWVLFTDADCVFHAESVGRALRYAESKNTDHLVLFPTGLMQTWGERMMISFPMVISNLARHRHWKIRDPESSEHIGVGAFNLIRHEAYSAVGTYSAMRMEVVDDMKLGELVKKAGLRQDVVFGPGMVSLRWAAGAAGVIGTLEKNLFAFFRFRLSLALVACAALFFLAVWPFVGLAIAPGWSKAGLAFAIAMIAAMYMSLAPQTRVSPLFFLACPISALLFIAAVLRSAFAALRDGAVTWRGTRYPLTELKKSERKT